MPIKKLRLKRKRPSEPEARYEILEDENYVDRHIATTVRQMRIEAERIEDRETREQWLDSLQTFARTGDVQVLLDMTEWRRKVVDMETFMFDSMYLGLEEGSIYRPLRELLIQMDEGSYNEVILMGAIGIGKTFGANVGLMRDIYKLSCMRNPQTSFGIQAKSFITFTVQSVRFSTAKMAIFNEIGSLMSGSPYFREVFPYNQRINSRMEWKEHRIQLIPATSSTTGILSLNVVGGLLDEANFLAKITKSKSQFADEQGEFDQARELYNILASRRKSRFNKRGKLPGHLFLASSSRYPTDFTEVRAKMSEMNGGKDPGILVYNKAQWEGKPRSNFNAEEFRVQVGGESARSKILADNEPPAPGCEVINVPTDFRPDFENDVDKAIRDLAGKPLLSINPFISRRETIQNSFDLARKYGYDQVYTLQEADLEHGIPTPLKSLLRRDVPSFRMAHVDLGWKKDACGIAIGHVAGYKVGVKLLGEGARTMEVLPVIAIDAVMRIVAPKGGEIDFEKVRSFLKAFRDEGDIDLRYVLTDGFQSVDTRQILKKQGFITDYQSVEKIESSRTMRDALYDGRLFMPAHAHLAKELRELELHYKNNKEKVDHPEHGSKDCVDGIVGVCQFLMSRRSTWSNLVLDRGPGYHLFGKSEEIAATERANLEELAKRDEVSDMIEDVTTKVRRRTTRKLTHRRVTVRK
jgi:hypothetical protein